MSLAVWVAMIKNFRSPALERAYKGDARRVNPNLATRIRNILRTLNRADALEDIEKLTGFHALRQNRAGEYAVTVTRNWRITFTVGVETSIDPNTKEQQEEFHVYDVDYEDYH